MNDYIRLDPTVWVKEEERKTFSLVDGIILDIDGVVIDVTPSFRVAISQTVQHFFQRILGFDGDEILLAPGETQLFKLAGGFNNDWDLSSSVVLFYLVKGEKLGTRDLSRLRKEGQTIEDLTTAIRRAGGGLENAQEVLCPTLTSEQRKRVEKAWDRTKIARLFQELYGGTDYCRRLYGFDPPFNRRRGLLNEERILLDKEILTPFLPRVAVFTGRTETETEVALEKASLKDMIPPEQIVFDGGAPEEMKKPRPGALIKLAQQMGSKVTVYVGDVPDDLMTVKNAAQADVEHIFLSCIVVSPLRTDEVAFYKTEKADIISLDVNSALRVIGGERWPNA